MERRVPYFAEEGIKSTHKRVVNTGKERGLSIEGGIGNILGKSSRTQPCMKRNLAEIGGGKGFGGMEGEARIYHVQIQGIPCS